MKRYLDIPDFAGWLYLALAGANGMNIAHRLNGHRLAEPAHRTFDDGMGNRWLVGLLARADR